MNSSSSGEDIWAALGLTEPPADVAAVRRAYAIQVRAIDADAEPQRFISLRQAFEEALRRIEQGDVSGSGNAEPGEEVWDTPPDETEFEMPQPLHDLLSEGQAKPRPDLERDAVVLPRGEAAAFRSAFLEAVGGHRLGPVRALYDEGLAKGLVPLGEERAFLADMIQTALDDPEVGLGDLQAMAREFDLESGRHTGLPPDLLQAFRARLAAEVWWRDQVGLARRFLLIGPPFPIRTARFLTGRWPAWRLMSGDVSWVRANLPAYQSHGPSLGARYDPARAQRLERRIERVTAPSPVKTILRWIFWTFIAVNLIVALATAGRH
jgi:hypothetical protein